MPVYSTDPAFRKHIGERHTGSMVDDFDVNDSAFTEYMGIEDVSRVSRGDLLALSRAMKSANNPLVAYAGGWAAFEAATYIDNGATPLRQRALALESAKEAWQKSQQTFNVARGRLPDGSRVGAYHLGFSMRAQYALSHASLMDVTVAKLAGETVNEADIAKATHVARRKITSFGSLLAEKTEPLLEDRLTKNGVCNELVSGLLLQDARPDSIVMPAGVRDDNNANPRKRGDLQVLTFSGKDAERVLVQITSDDDKELGGNMLTIHSKTDLPLVPGTSPYDTLRAYVNMTWEERPSETVRQYLSALTGRLAGRVARISRF